MGEGGSDLADGRGEALVLLRASRAANRNGVSRVITTNLIHGIISTSRIEGLAAKDFRAMRR